MSRPDVHDQPPAAPEEPRRGHAFDGIEEYDNPMPGWWKAIFWLTVAFSIPYFFYYEIGVGEGVDAAYQRDLGEFYEAQAAKLGDLAPDEVTIVALSHDPKMRLAGQALFRSHCAVCHGADGGGGTGPNLTDEHYLNIKQPVDLFRLIKEGQVGKGMPAWGDRFSQAQLVVLSAYAAGLRGTSPARPKEPQGEVIPPWPAPPSTEDAAKVAAAGR